ncbi:MAG: hypothetical protein Q7S77_00315 [Candidatus Staskawiczbacteria bacterium]|nr:hypothetical protein [Candidatus Staskawiczbacteria bacterium]
MLNFIKQNWFKLSFSISVALIGASVFYYFVIFVPDQKQNADVQQEKEDAFLMKQKCQTIGQKIYEDDAKTLGRDNMLIPEYVYSKDLNTCLYFGGHVEENSYKKWIKDSLANEEIFSFFELNGRVLNKSFICETCVPLEEFDMQKEILFKN